MDNNFKEQLKDFNPKELYSLFYNDDYYQLLIETERRTVLEMITNMIINNASDDEMLRAIKYSMCVINAKKYNIDLIRAFKDYEIKMLQNKYITDSKILKIIEEVYNND